MIVATVHTAHFEFVALGHDHAEADAALLDGWAEHCRQYPDAEPELMADRIAESEVDYAEVRAGQCLRDGSPVT